MPLHAASARSVRGSSARVQSCVNVRFQNQCAGTAAVTSKEERLYIPIGLVVLVLIIILLIYLL